MLAVAESIHVRYCLILKKGDWMYYNFLVSKKKAEPRPSYIFGLQGCCLCSSRRVSEWNRLFFSEAVLCLHFKLNIPSPSHVFAYVPYHAHKRSWLQICEEFAHSFIYSFPSAQYVERRIEGHFLVLSLHSSIKFIMNLNSHTVHGLRL